MNSNAGFVLVLLVSTILPRQQVEAQLPSLSSLISTIIQVAISLLPVLQAVVSSLTSDLEKALGNLVSQLMSAVSDLMDALSAAGISVTKKKKAKKEE